MAATSCSALCLLVARPAYAADPPSLQRPAAVTSTVTADSGTGTGTIQVPFKPFPSSLGPLAAAIFAKEAALEGMNQDIQSLTFQVNAQVAATNMAYADWQTAVAQTSAAQDALAAAVAQAYEQNDSLGPLLPYKDDMQQLSLIAPGLLQAPPNAGPAAVNLTALRQAEQTALTSYQDALTQQEAMQAQQTALQTTFYAASAQLTELKSANQAALAAAAAQQQQIDEGIGQHLPISTNIDGQVAGPQALAAVAFAMTQLGKPYVFGAEGPDSYDCSGLVWASYRHAGVDIARISRDQEHTTTPISIDELLPGDLLFFSTTSNTDWQQITHVGMYIGNGKMIEAPQPGENVKIAGVWWSAFFGATRVVPAVAAPTPTPTPSPSQSPSPSPSHSPSPRPTHSHSPSPSPSTSPSPSPSESPSPSPSPSPSDSPSPSPSDSPSPSPSDSPSPSPSDSPSPSPSDSPSPSSSASGTPSTDPSTSPSDSPSPSTSTSASTSAPPGP